jgi:hypothetical protein
MLVNGERGADHDQRRTITRRSRRLRYAQPTHSLDWDGYRVDHLTKTIKWTWNWQPPLLTERTNVVSDVVHDDVAPEAMQLPRTLDRVGHTHLQPSHPRINRNVGEFESLIEARDVERQLDNRVHALPPR